MNPTDKELQELDAYLAEHVLGWQWYKYLPEDNHAYSGCRTLTDRPHKYLVKAKGNEPLAPDAFYLIPKCTTDPADAFLVMEKCAHRLRQEDKEETVSVGWDEPYFVVEKTNCSPSLRCEAVTLPSAISQFAQKLFSK